MPCSVKPCFCTGREQKVRCQFWSPSKNSKYYSCALYLTQKMPCPKKDSPCLECEYYIPARKNCKYETDEERRKAKNARNRRYYERKKMALQR